MKAYIAYYIYTETEPGEDSVVLVRAYEKRRMHTRL